LNIKPPVCDGKTSWQIFKKQFEAAANNWTSSDKATALVLSLREEAVEVLQTLDGSHYKNYDDLIQHLEMRFGNKHLEQVSEQKPEKPRNLAAVRGDIDPNACQDIRERL